MRTTKYTAEVLAPIVEASRTLSDVLRRLGLPLTGGNSRHINTRIRQAQLDTKHLRTHSFAARCAAIPADALSRLVMDSTSVAQILMKLEMPIEGRSHRELTRRIRELGINCAHLRGQGWSRGETSASHPSVERSSKRQSYPNSVAFSENSPLLSGDLGRRLRAMGWRYECAWCGIAQWRDKPLTLHVDHINGINNDNRLLNLRFLCPNCHSQTETYGNRRR